MMLTNLLVGGVDRREEDELGEKGLKRKKREPSMCLMKRGFEVGHKASFI